MQRHVGLSSPPKSREEGVGETDESSTTRLTLVAGSLPLFWRSSLFCSFVFSALVCSISLVLLLCALDFLWVFEVLLFLFFRCAGGRDCFSSFEGLEVVGVVFSAALVFFFLCELFLLLDLDAFFFWLDLFVFFNPFGSCIFDSISAIFYFIFIFILIFIF